MNQKFIAKTVYLTVEGRTDVIFLIFLENQLACSNLKIRECVIVPRSVAATHVHHNGRTDR